MPKPLPRDPAARSLLLSEAKAYLDHHTAMLDELEQLFDMMPRSLGENADHAWAAFRESIAHDPVIRARVERVDELARKVPPRLNSMEEYLPEINDAQLRLGAAARWPGCFQDPQLRPFVAGVEQTRDLMQRLLDQEPAPDLGTPVGSGPRDFAGSEQISKVPEYTQASAARIACVERHVIVRAVQNNKLRSNGRAGRGCRIPADALTEWQHARLNAPERQESDTAVRRKLGDTGRSR